MMRPPIDQKAVTLLEEIKDSGMDVYCDGECVWISDEDEREMLMATYLERINEIQMEVVVVICAMAGDGQEGRN